VHGLGVAVGLGFFGFFGLLGFFVGSGSGGV
jgi:hypothetical protein